MPNYIWIHPFFRDCVTNFNIYNFRRFDFKIGHFLYINEFEITTIHTLILNAEYLEKFCKNDSNNIEGVVSSSADNKLELPVKES